MIDHKSYLELMIPYVNFVKQQTRKVDDKLSYYGTGESAHWPIQSNFNVAGGLAVLAGCREDIGLDKEELADMALRFFRYNIASHHSGNGKCSDGGKWGRSWISVLGMERFGSGQIALEKFMTDDDKENFRKLRIDEANWLLNNQEVLADMCSESRKNRPEADYWDGSFLYRAAMDYPDVPERELWLEKSTAFLLNAISHPLDAASSKMFNGKTLREWHVGFNFTENYSLDHHGYMNVGYSVITLSHAAYLYLYCKSRGYAFPDAGAHHLKDLWDVVKNFIYPDGRLLRIGGDTRARYTYCQVYLLPILLMAQDLYQDQDAAVFENGLLNILKTEQRFNPDGSFYGTRLKEMEHQSRYYYTRLQSDPFAVLSTGADIRSRMPLLQAPEQPEAPKAASWHDDYHGADLIRTAETVRSMVRHGAEGPVALAQVLNDSSLGEWCNNGHAQLLCHIVTVAPVEGFHRQFSGGFINSGRSNIYELAPWGEGESSYIFARTSSACAALPDGRSMIVLEYVKTIKEHALNSLRTIGWKIPNDLFNNGERTYYWEGGSKTLKKHGKEGVIDTGSRHINVENKGSFHLGYGADSFKLYAPEKAMGVIKSCREFKSLYINEICGDVTEDVRRRRMPGEILADTGYAVVTGVDFQQGRNYSLRQLETPETVRAVEFTTPDAGSWIFAANFGETAVDWQGETIAPGECSLKQS